MKRKSSESVILFLLCAGSAYLVGIGTPQASSHNQVPKSVTRTLTFAERVAYQYAIEDVYWRHRIWPKDNPKPKPLLDAVISREEIEKKVTDYLRKSQALADYWQRPITVAQLQAEMERMAVHTKQPEVLRELFEVLGNDPFIIAECLARPLVAERLVSGLTNGRDGSPSRPLSLANNAARPAVAPYQIDNVYKLPEISVSPGCVDDTWHATTMTNAVQLSVPGLYLPPVSK